MMKVLGEPYKTHGDGWGWTSYIKPWVLIKGWTCETLWFNWAVGRIAPRVTVGVNLVTLYVEELDGGPTPFQCFAVHHCGQWRFRFFWPKNREGLTDLDELWPNYRGDSAHSHNFFPMRKIPVTREKIVIRQNFGIFVRENRPRYSYQNFTTYDPWGPHITQSKFRPWPLKLLRNWGKTFWGWGPQVP